MKTPKAAKATQGKTVTVTFTGKNAREILKRAKVMETTPEKAAADWLALSFQCADEELKKSQEAYRQQQQSTAQSKSNTRPVEISPYLWGRIGMVGNLDQMTRQQVITAALISFVDGEEALGRYLNQIDPPERYSKPPVDESAPLTVTLQGEAAEAIRKVSRKIRRTPSQLAQIHCEASLAVHGVIATERGAEA